MKHFARARDNFCVLHFQSENVFQRDRRFSFDDSTVAIANFLQEWCDEKNKLVLISYDSSSNLPEGRTWFDLKLEGHGSINIK